MTTMGNNKMVFCKNCVNCMRVSSLNNDVVDWKCEKGFDNYKINRRCADEINVPCIGFDSGSYKGEDAEIFKDVIVCNHNVKRKQKAWDFYEGCWRK